MSSWARASTSWVGLALAVAAVGQPFGRFGYSHVPQVPGFTIEATGFRALSPTSDTFRWPAPLAGLKRTRSSDQVAWYRAAGAKGSPSQIRVNLRAPGWSVYLERGLRLSLSSLNAPYLTTGETTYGEGIPTPKSPWIVVSFTDRQPPVLLVGEDAPLQLVVEGRPGDWTLKTVGDHSGWVRVCLPLGVRPLATASTGALGAVARRVRDHEAFWTGAVPVPVETQVRFEPGVLIATWVYDRPGVGLPVPLVLAAQGGYGIRVETEVRDSGADLPCGPQVYAAGPRVSVRFPLRQVPPGRPVTMGEPSQLPALTEGSEPRVLAAAGSSLLATSDPSLARKALDVVNTFLAAAPYSTEPVSQARLPFGPSGTGMAEVGAYALLLQALRRGGETAANPDALLTSLLWRRDWRAWRLVGADPDATARAGAALAAACALSDSAPTRLEGVMLRAGLACEVGLRLYQAKRGLEASRVGDPGLGWLTTALFDPAGLDPWGRALASPVRVLSSHRVRAATGLLIEWQAGPDVDGPLRLSAPRPLRLEGLVNLGSLETTSADGATVVQYRPAGPGPCQARVVPLGGPVPPLPETPRLPVRLLDGR